MGLQFRYNHFLITNLPCLMALISLIKVLSFLGAIQKFAFLLFWPIFMVEISEWIFFKRSLYSLSSIEWSVSESSSGIVLRTCFLVLVTVALNYLMFTGVVGVLEISISLIFGSHSLVGSSSLTSSCSTDATYGWVANLCYFRISMKLRMSEWMESVSLVIDSWDNLICWTMLVGVYTDICFIICLIKLSLIFIKNTIQTSPF